MNDRSHNSACFAFLSAVEKTPVVEMPILWAVRAILQAISPRFAISNLSNIIDFLLFPCFSYAVNIYLLKLYHGVLG